MFHDICWWWYLLLYKRLTTQAELTVITILFRFLFITNIAADKGHFTPITRVRMAFLKQDSSEWDFDRSPGMWRGILRASIND